MESGCSIAVIGAGPIGLEAALHAHVLGHPVRVYERGRIGENLRRWGHVTLFSPASINRSGLARRLLAERGVSGPDDDACLSGASHTAEVLEPLARLLLPDGCVVERTRVVGVGRDGLSKRAPLGETRRGGRFRLLLDGPDGERVESADVVLDCSGTYGNHAGLGPGGLPAPGEAGLGERVSYLLEPIDGPARPDYEGRRVLLVGSGLSAATALAALIALPGTTVRWLARDAVPAPYRPIDDDPLPERRRLCELGNRAAAGEIPGVRFERGVTIERFERGEDGAVVASYRSVDGADRVEVDRVLALVGYRPDRSVARELQLHECYASEGPMALAASLLDSAGGDCLARVSAGPQSLVTPEPGFFVLGAKSYGRNADFLIRVGLEQVRDVFRLIEGRDDLDIEAAAAPSTERADR